MYNLDWLEVPTKSYLPSPAHAEGQGCPAHFPTKQTAEIYQTFWQASAQWERFRKLLLCYLTTKPVIHSLIENLTSFSMVYNAGHCANHEGINFEYSPSISKHDPIITSRFILVHI